MPADKLDFKKKYKDLYLPKGEPELIQVPKMNFIVVAGEGAPESESYQNAVQILYSLTYTIKMSKMSGSQPEGYIEYVVPPLEGLWDSAAGVGYDPNRDQWRWTSMIRQPDFVTQSVFEWACKQAAKKKPELDFNRARLTTYDEGLCVQMMHTGPYSRELGSIDRMQQFIAENGLIDCCGTDRKHHEVYLKDPRKTAPEKLKTVLRHPVSKKL
ncbi:GyrI-like domain-containing protein [Paenibacillus puldeungensis]|uniref:GyrI-like domain-containing protein n=1 Tax=Paenibacillus puldeungensis TaxID=696536 RepID=A0ABW3S220_9BACL